MTPREDVEVRVVILQAIGELDRGLTVLAGEIRTRQHAAAVESVLLLRVTVTLLDQLIPSLLAQIEGRAQIRLCKCGNVAERGQVTCWRCS